MEVSTRVAEPGPLIAMKLQAVMNRSEDKQGTDLLDIIQLTLDTTARPAVIAHAGAVDITADDLELAAELLLAAAGRAASTVTVHDDSMSDQRAGRSRRIESAADFGAENGRADPGYASSFAADFPDADTRSPEQWARMTLEGAPRVLRWFVLIGWKAVLRLRLEPRGAASNVMGWRIRTTTPDRITLEVNSSLVAARKVLRVDHDRVTLTTFVWFERAQGRILWSVIAPIHHRIEPLLLTLATSRGRRERARKHR